MAVQVGTRNRRVTMASRPTGFPTEADFAIDESEVAEPGPGELLVRNLWVSVDPYQRGRMSTQRSYAKGRTVVFAYPRTGEPGKVSLVDDWDMIPGARGCTPQTCSFRDLFAELKAAGSSQVFGLSTQSNEYQAEMAARLHLPFPVLSDEKLKLTEALQLPTMEVAGLVLIKRLALVVDDGRITHVFYPVFPPDRNAGDVLAWLKENPA